MDLAACRAACVKDTNCHAIQWQGLEKNLYADDKPGQCFLVSNDCTDQRPYESRLAPSFCMDIERCERGGDERGQAPSSVTNPFDSHICFAAARPVSLADSERIYYMVCVCVCVGGCVGVCVCGWVR